MPITVRLAKEQDLGPLIAAVCSLSSAEVDYTLEQARGNAHLATAFAGSWPTSETVLAGLTINKARRLGLEREIAAAFGLDEDYVLEELRSRSGNMHVGTAFYGLQPESDQVEFGDDDDGALDDGDEDEDYDDSDEDDESTLQAECAPAYMPFFEEFAYSNDARNRQVREYQAEAVEHVIAALDPASPQLLHLPTGAGKTFTANMIVQQWQSQNDKAVLWIAKDWFLLRQAAGDVNRRRPNPRLSRLGGDQRLELRDLAPAPETAVSRRGSIIYTTTTTAQRRVAHGLFIGVGLVVWDECHWGERAKAAKIITRCKRGRVPLLGLTATPRVETGYNIAYSKTFADLMPQWLARPEFHNADTGVEWTPDIGSNRDVTATSLTVLAQSDKRNKFIVDYYKRSFSHCLKTLIFAVDIGHANKLGERFKRAGYGVVVVHSGNDDASNQHGRAAFVRGEATVLINVAQMTHGVDIPDIETIFLCRPTASDILFSQMVGRGARKAPNKDFFNVVDFVDNLTRHGELMIRPKLFFRGVDFGEVNATATGLVAHGFDPSGAPAWVVPGPGVSPAAEGLWYRKGQTFGIEFEITDAGSVPRVTSARWRDVAAELLAELRKALPNRVAAEPIPAYAGVESGQTKNQTVWNVEHDSSAGWEVTTRILEGRDGLLEVAAACEAMERVRERCGLVIDYRTGIHVHLGWSTDDVDELKRLVRLVRLFEPALGTLVGPSRLVSFDGVNYDFDAPNEFCRPLASKMTEASITRAGAIADMQALVADYETRYSSLNLRPFFSKQSTVEIRMHSGSLEAPKVLLWVSLWQQMLWAAGQDRDVPRVPDVERILPRGDIVGLAKRFLPDAGQPQQQELLDKLAARRAQVIDLWANSEQLRGWCKFERYWRQGDSFLAQAAAARQRVALGADGDVNWSALVALIDGLDLAGVVQHARFRDPATRTIGHSVIECLMPSGNHEPLVHVWRSTPFKVWVYTEDPGEDLGTGGSSYGEYRSVQAEWLTQVQRAIERRYSPPPQELSMFPEGM